MWVSGRKTTEVSHVLVTLSRARAVNMSDCLAEAASARLLLSLAQSTVTGGQSARADGRPATGQSVASVFKFFRVDDLSLLPL